MHYHLFHLLFNQGFDSLTGSSEGVSTGNVRKISHVVLKLMRIFSGYFGNTLS